MSSESILEKIINSKQAADLSQINPKVMIETISANLSTKEKDIISRRFGLTGKNKEPLEKIGKFYNLTRERIRQIEASAVKKICQNNQNKKTSEVLESLEKIIARLMETYGGAVEENFLFSKVFEAAENNKENQQILTFILGKLSGKFIRITDPQNFNPGWDLKIVNLDKIKNLSEQLVELFKKIGKPLKLSELIVKIENQEKDELKSLTPEQIESLLYLSANLGKNPFDDFGLLIWGLIKPKRMADKIYLVLKKANQPLHFIKIAELINKARFDHKLALPQTVHNELIIDQKFVLVGRGIYALTEWGYQPGVVSEVINKVLQEAGKPLTKEEIVNKVLKQRIVKEMTIYIALIDKKKFKKLPTGHYTLAESAEGIKKPTVNESSTVKIKQPIPSERET